VKVSRAKNRRSFMVEYTEGDRVVAEVKRRWKPRPVEPKIGSRSLGKHRDSGETPNAYGAGRA
jgi:hypothetical protein